MKTHERFRRKKLEVWNVGPSKINERMKEFVIDLTEYYHYLICRYAYTVTLPLELFMRFPMSTMATI